MQNSADFEKKVKAAFSDEEFISSLANIMTAEEAQKAFSEKGIDLTLDEVEKLGEFINGNSELDEDALDNVSGGFSGMLLIYGAVALVSAAAGIKAGWNAGKKSACK